MLTLVTRPSINRGCSVGDVRMAKDDAHNVRRKTKIAEQCRHGAAEIVSVPS